MTPNINEVLDRYWDGETSLEEEKILKAYFQGGSIADEHLPYCDLFGYMVDQSNICSPVSNDIDTLLNKYWEGETELKEEEILKAYFKSEHVAEGHLPFAGLFEYFDDHKKLKYHDSSEFNNQTVKVFTFRKFIYAAAAVLVLVLGAVTVMQLMEVQNTSNKSSMVQEIEDPEEALRVTKEALALVSSKFRASQESVRENMGALEKAAIFK